MLPKGFRFRTAEGVSVADAVRAHRDAWYPSSFTEVAFERVRRTWPYRADLHVLIQAPDGALAATAIIWLDKVTRTACWSPALAHRRIRPPGTCTTAPASAS